MRRGRDGPMRRNTPYGGGRSDFGPNRGGRPDVSPMRPPFGGGFDDNYGFSNQDRRGFALPNQYENSGPQQRGGFQRSYSSGSGFGQGSYGGSRSDTGRHGGMFPFFPNLQNAILNIDIKLSSCDHRSRPLNSQDNICF